MNKKVSISHRFLLLRVILCSAMLSVMMGEAVGEEIPMIGSVTAIQREANVTHPGELQVEMVKLGESVLFQDLYETKEKAKLKLLFHDDSILSLGENTRLQITENIYDPGQGRRSTVVDMLSGSVRALVGKIFGGPGSRFEIHTSSAVAAARGTYFIVWTFERGGADPTGVVNIGDSGKVEVKNADSQVVGSVILGRNEFTVVDSGLPPSLPVVIDTAMLNSLLLSTEVKDQAVGEIPKGMDAPGSDVSAESPVPVPLTPVKAARGGAAGGDDRSRLLEEGDTIDREYPVVPPILQEPSMNTTPVNVELVFPGD